MQSMICILLLVVAALCCDSTAHAAQYSETDEENLCRFGAVYGQLISGMSFLSSFAQQNYNETIQLSSRALNLNNLVAMDDDTMQSIKEMAYNVGDDIYALKQIVNSEIIGMRNFVDKIKNDYQLDSEGRRVATAASAAFTQCYNEQTNNWKTMEEELEELASNLDTLREMIKQQSINSDDDETMEQYISRTMGNTGIFKPRVNADTLAETYAFLIKSIKTYVYGISQKRTELESAVIGVLKPALIAKVAECQQFYRSVSVSAA
ncbi:hypothetical protein ERJ75_000183600 [Trypanosoma vivax]|nr:hypothetical protein ERJ75_000183600 [Trypanosoma vivax]